jgi:CHASE2 domain-containing sensor protein
MPQAFWTVFHVYWGVIAIAICWRWFRQPRSATKAGMLLLGIGALVSIALFLYADFNAALWQL